MQDEAGEGSPWWYRSAARRALLSAARSARRGDWAEVLLMPPLTLRALLTGGRGPAEIRDRGASLPASNGLVGVGGRVDPETLMAAYRRGIHQSSHVMPPKWRVYDKRMVMFFDRFHISKRLRRTMRQSEYGYTFDKVFEAVVQGCARPRAGAASLTWLLPSVIAAYRGLHLEGHAHSLEVWDRDGRLVAGLFGVAYGRIFITESLFSNEGDAAKAGFAVLMRHLQARGFAFHDNGQGSPHFLGIGAEQLPREAFLDLVDRLGAQEPPLPVGRWTIDETLTGDWDAAAAPGVKRADLLG